MLAICWSRRPRATKERGRYEVTLRSGLRIVAVPSVATRQTGDAGETPRETAAACAYGITSTSILIAADGFWELSTRQILRIIF